MATKHPSTGVTYFFVDKCMPFGHSISCAIFQRISDRLAHLARFTVRDKVQRDPLSNYLDDFLFMALTKILCNFLVESFIKLCERIGVPIALEKTEWADTVMVFLGILLDGRNHLLAVAEDKRIRTLNTLYLFTHKSKATVKEVQSLAGFLNFLNRAIFSGREFTRRMYAKITSSTRALKSYHHVRIDGEFKSDCKVWIKFLEQGNKAVCCPFVDLTKSITATELNFATDAAKREFLGMGGIFNTHWFFAQWETGFIKKCDPSIEYLELLTVSTGFFLWGQKHLSNRRIIVFCDNQTVVIMINNTTSSCKNCMYLIRQLTLLCLRINTRIFAKWIRGSDNILPDLLSRQKIDKFKGVSAHLNMDRYPEVLPEALLSVSRIWIKN